MAQTKFAPKKIYAGIGKRLDAYRKSKFYSLMYEKGVLYFVVSFLIPAIIMTLAFKKSEIHPFGNNQMLVVDLWHQYFPFFRVVREKLVTGGSFLYSWQNGMGTNFLSLISYYAASPLNWIAALFSEENARDVMTFILIAKIGFSGSFFSCFLRYTFKRRDFSICIFSTLFALCSYMLGYYWNVMWFDTVALFPLVMTGVVAIAREGKWKTFTFALALSLVSNYYIAYFTCIFTVFMFAASIILNAKGVKDFFWKIWIMIRSAVLGIALAGFMLLPAYFGLQLTYSANNIFPKEREFYESWVDIFANLISYSEPAMKEGLPNFACGMLAIVMFGVFLFSGGIKIREKISALLMLALIAVSCNLNVLNYIWHGFHFTNMIPYRFAFIFSFVLVVAAFRAYDVILTNGVKVYQIILMLAFPFVVFYLNYRIKTADGVPFELDKPLKRSLIIAAAFILIFVAIRIFPFTNVKVRNTVLSLCVGAAVISECYSNAVIGVQTVGNSDYVSYPTRNTEIQTLLDRVETNDDSPFYRTEVSKTYTLNDSALYGYNGISQFSSSANVSVTRFIRNLGMYASEAGNRYYYRISTPVVNSMLGLKYIISKEAKLKGEAMALTQIDSELNTYLYSNNYTLSIGYMVEDSILDLQSKSYLNPFEYQNDLVRYCSGISDPCFTAQPVALAEYSGATVNKNSYGNYTLVKEGTSSSRGTATYTFNGLPGSYLYGYVSNGVVNTVNVRKNGVIVDSNISVSDYPIVFPMGNAQEGESATVELVAKTDRTSGTFKLMVYALNQSVFEEVYASFADEQLEITEFSDNEITGKITALKDGVLFLSIPYEKGWSVYVDGEKVETVKLAQAMLGAKIPAGTHDIRIVYIPEGFKTGTAATGVSAVLCVVIALLDMRKNKKKNAAAAAVAENVSEVQSEETDNINGSDSIEIQEDMAAENPAPVKTAEENPPEENTAEPAESEENEKS